MNLKQKAEKEKLLKRIAEKRARIDKLTNEGVVKMKRVELPTECNFHCQPLFALPPHLMRPVASCYKKKLSTETIKKKASKSSSLEAYSTLRKQKEEFRKRLVDVIMSQDGEMELEDVCSPNDKEMLRYYYYIRHGVDTVHVSPLEQKLLDSVLALVPEKLKRWRDVLANTVEDMREDYTVAIKKSIVDFVLQDPNTSTVTTSKISKQRNEALGYNQDIVKIKLGKILYVINPCIAQLINIWYNQFRELRIINIKLLMGRPRAYKLQEFQFIVNKEIEKTKRILMDSYFSQVIDIFLMGSKLKSLPNPAHLKRFNKFYDCCSTLMTYHLQSLCLESLYDFMEYIADVKYKNKGFQINVIIKDCGLAFDPSFDEIREALLNTIGIIISAVMNVPRLETILYLDYQGEPRYLKPTIPNSLLNSYNTILNKLLDEQCIAPQGRLQDFDEYLPIITGEMDEKIKTFLIEKHTFEEYVANILTLKEIADSIPVVKEHVITLSMYDMHRKELILSLASFAQSMKQALTDQMNVDYQAICKGLSDQYQSLSEKMLKVPLNTAELMNLINFAKEVELKTLQIMEDKLGVVMKYILFLADHILFTTAEMKQNALSFLWNARFPKIIETHRQMVDTKIEEFQELLSMRIKKFEDDLDLYATLIEEFEYFGNIDELPEYYKKAEYLDTKLVQALGKIDAFNEEEAAYGLELSQYPLRKVVHDKLGPFKKLFDSAMDFINQHHAWTTSKVGSFDPEMIETEVGTAYRNVYKLEKMFSDRPVTQELAMTVILIIQIMYL